MRSGGCWCLMIDRRPGGYVLFPDPLSAADVARLREEWERLASVIQGRIWLIERPSRWRRVWLRLTGRAMPWAWRQVGRCERV